MIRSGIILTTVVALLIGTIGVPMQLHSCTMAGEQTFAESCSMCGTQKEEVSVCHDTQEENRPCCSNEKVIHHTDPTVLGSVKVDFRLSFTFLPALFSVFSVENFTPYHTPTIPDNHSPPLPGGGQSTYLFNSTFLI